MTKRMAKAHLCDAICKALRSGGFYIDQLDGESESDCQRHEEAMDELAEEMCRLGAKSRGHEASMKEREREPL